MNENGEADPGSGGAAPAAAWKPAARYHQRTYNALLILVVVLGLPMIGVPIARHRLEARVALLRAAIQGERLAPPPALVRIGENREPFPEEYERPRARPDYLAKLDLPAPKLHVVISDQAGATTVKRAPATARAGSQASGAATQASGAPAATGSGTAATGGDPAAGPVYQKGKGEQEAYDLLVSGHKTLAGMLKGSDATLKFQDWAAAGMGENSYHVMVTFVRVADDVPQRFIWKVNLSTKEVIPLSSLAMSISR